MRYCFLIFKSANLISHSGRIIFATPVLLKPINIKDLKTFQDEGLMHNNPVDLVLWEYQKIWPSTIIPDIILLLGTSTKKKPIY